MDARTDHVLGWAHGALLTPTLGPRPEEGESAFAIPLVAAQRELIRYPEKRKQMGLRAHTLIASWTMENWAGRIVGAWQEPEST